MIGVFAFLVVLAIIRLGHRLDRRLERRSREPIRIDVYHHWPSGDPGERWPEETPLLLDRVADNVVPLRRGVK